MWKTIKEQSIFNVRPFTELVQDERLITNKKDFKYSHSDSWKVEIDSNRFRIGTNFYFEGKDNLVFLGDSVPFGWGVNGGQSVPSKFYNILEKDYRADYGIINAAIPSYSLYQAIKRYEYEIEGKFPIKCIVLQIYDPVLQFLIWGKKWNKRMCWTSKDTLIASQNVAREDGFSKRLLRRYSSIYHELYGLKYTLGKKLKKFRNSLLITINNNNEAFDYFERENLFVLEGFHSLLKDEDIVLVILPVNPTDSVTNILNRKIKNFNDFKRKALFIAIDRLNKTLYNFASSHKNVYYFDIISYFDKIGRDGLFVDDCCHLSEYGAEKQAEFIFEQLRTHNLL